MRDHGEEETSTPGGGRTMKIMVIYQDGSMDAVNSDELDKLLLDGSLLAFRRENEWALVGVAPVRDPVRTQGSSWRDRSALIRQRALVRISKG